MLPAVCVSWEVLDTVQSPVCASAYHWVLWLWVLQINFALRFLFFLKKTVLSFLSHISCWAIAPHVHNIYMIDEPFCGRGERSGVWLQALPPSRHTCATAVWKVPTWVQMHTWRAASAYLGTLLWYSQSFGQKYSTRVYSCLCKLCANDCLMCTHNPPNPCSIELYFSLLKSKIPMIPQRKC